MADRESFKGINLAASIQRLDRLLDKSPPKGKMELGFGLGTRLALGMADEIEKSLPIGSQTGKIIADWVVKYGEDQVEVAIEIARNFLTTPEKLKEGLEKRLFPEGRESEK